MNRYLTIFLLLFSVLLVSACGGKNSAVGNILGLNKRAPDEFLVISQPSLTLPPDFILSPTAGEGLQTQTDPNIEGAIFGVQAEEEAIDTTAGDSVSYLLQRTGATNTGDDIRQLIDLETSQLVEEDKNFVQEFLGTGGDFGDTIDAEQEYLRLQQEGATE